MTSEEQEGAGSGPGEASAGAEGLRCDFCGEIAPSVRRVALDEGYDRLVRRHAVQYACEACSERKERERRG